jgi:hypothetical protein
VRTPEPIYAQWLAFVTITGTVYEETLEHSITRAMMMGLTPRLTPSVLKVCRELRLLRAGQTIPLPLLVFLCNSVLPILPISSAQKIFRLTTFVFRKSLLGRLGQKVAGRFGGGKAATSWYEGYRNAGS